MSDLIHGGDLYAASTRYGIPINDWVDLSTGINPCAYPVPLLDEQSFKQLPYQSPEFKRAVTQYYGIEDFVACNGSQQIIDCLPEYLPAFEVLLPELGYQEHLYSWQKHGRECLFYPSSDYELATQLIEKRLSQGNPFHLVVINPNNPTGLSFTPTQLRKWAERMPTGGHLIVDEAFIDLTPEGSLLSDYDQFTRLTNLVVLRSFGKFFGLAGLRLGFLFTAETLLETIRCHIGPWAVNGPAQQVAMSALNDVEWQQQAKDNILSNSDATLSLFTLLINALKHVSSGGSSLCVGLATSGLFNALRVETGIAAELYEFFAQRGVLLRLIADSGSVLNSSVCDSSLADAYLADISLASHADCSSGYSLLRFGIINKDDDVAMAKLQQVINEYILTLD